MFKFFLLGSCVFFMATNANATIRHYYNNSNYDWQVVSCNYGTGNVWISGTDVPSCGLQQTGDTCRATSC